MVLPKEGAFLSLELVAIKDKNGNIKEKLTYNNKDILFFIIQVIIQKVIHMINFHTYNKGVSMRNNIINSDKTEGNLMFMLEVFD
ncbi:MAG: hypothetical protein HC854_17475 [Flavobacterium sp.]|nr:hypothetical protein [Flavobacterium sp.]